MEHSIDLDKVIKGITHHKLGQCDMSGKICPYWEEADCMRKMLGDALSLLKEQEAEIRQLRLALDIAKGTCKGIKSGGGQFADMPTMQSAT